MIKIFDRCFARLTKKKREDSSKSINERGDVTTATTEIQRIVRDYCGQLCISKQDNLEINS